MDLLTIIILFFGIGIVSFLFGVNMGIAFVSEKLDKKSKKVI